MALFSNRWVIGIDESGRGPLAGPVTLAAVLCPKRTAGAFLRKIKDSKHLSLKKREEWFCKMKEHPRIFYFFSSVGPLLIDRVGITKAIDMGVKRILRRACNIEKTTEEIEILLDGGLKAPAVFAAQKTIIRGDENVPVIAAASIVAKVSRDRKMARLSSEFPEYSFEVHKGYGTRLHYKMIRKHGMCPIHRKTFIT